MKEQWIEEFYERFLELRSAFDRRIETAATQMGVNNSELLLLLDIYAHPNTKMIASCQRSGQKKSAVSKMVDRLCERGLLTKTVNPDNGRELILNVTDQFVGTSFCYRETMHQLFPTLELIGEDELKEHVRSLIALKHLLEV